MKNIFFSFFNCLIPKNKNQIIFYSAFGYDDSARAFYEYLLIKRPNLKCVWVFDKHKYQKVDNCKCVINKTIRCAWNYCRSKYVFETHSFFGKSVSKRQTLVFSLHGMPFKGSNIKEKKEKIMSGNMISTSTGKVFNDEVELFTSINKDNTYDIGIPRNDFLFKKQNVLHYFKMDKFDKVLIWMPTFRKSSQLGQDGVSADFGIPCIHENDLADINTCLKSNNYLLILKLHPWALDQMCDLDKYSNIISLENKDIQPYNLYHLLGECDALITDFSSVFIDFLLVDKPICFAYDDLEEYKKSRDFMFKNYEDYMCGEKAHNKEDIIKFINNLKSEDAFKEKRKETRDLFHTYQDGKTCERLDRLLFK